MCVAKDYFGEIFISPQPHASTPPQISFLSFHFLLLFYFFLLLITHSHPLHFPSSFFSFFLSFLSSLPLTHNPAPSPYFFFLSLSLSHTHAHTRTHERVLNRKWRVSTGEHKAKRESPKCKNCG
jgi:hypothetical protein